MDKILQFVRKEEGDRGLIVFLPGLSGSNAQWAKVVAALAEAGVSLAYGPPILAQTDVFTQSPRVEDVGAAISDAVVGGGYKRVVIASHSVGAFVAFDVARRLPDTVVGVVAVNGALLGVARFLDHPATELFRRPKTALTALRLFALSAVPTTPAFRKRVTDSEFLSRLLVGKLVPREVTSDLAARQVLAEGTNQPGVLRGLRVNRHHWSAFLRIVDQVNCPVEFIVGAMDPMNSAADAREMAALFSSGSVEVLRGVGHAAPLEAPGPIVSSISSLI